MTDVLTAKEFSRRSFVKGGGALVIGFSLGGAAITGKAAAAIDPYASNNPTALAQVDTFIKIHADNTASIYTGREELGQGSSVGFLQIAGEELEMSLSQLRFIGPDTALTPDTARTAGSTSIAEVGPRVRAAAAYAKQALLGLAATQLGVPVASLTVQNGVVSGGGRSVTYSALLGDRLFNVAMPNQTRETGQAPAKPVSQYKLVGTRPVRIDIPAKATGQYVYVQNIKVPGMLHGRVVRPLQGAHGDGTNPPIISVDERSIAGIPGARVVRRGNFLGVVAPQEYAAIQAASQLKVKWADPPVLPTSGNLWKQMRQQDSAGLVPASIQMTDVDSEVLLTAGDVDRALASAAHVVSGTYKYAYNGHAVIGPHCCVADVTPNGARILTSTQAPNEVQRLLVPLLGLPLNRIRVTYYEGAGTFGGSQGRYETSLAAAVMSQLAGKPVRLQFMRGDEHGWDNFAPAQLIDLRGGIDAKGKIVGADYTGFQIPGFTTNPTEQMLGRPLAITTTLSARHSTAMVNGVQYDIPNRRVIGKLLPLRNNYFKTSSMRAPGDSQSVFAFEQLVDDLAHAAKMDPIAFRLHNLRADPDDHWSGIFNALQTISDWKPRVSASNLSDATVVTGRGIAVYPHGGDGYAGVVADVEVNKKTGKIVAKHMYVAEEAGLTINPALVENQMIGAVTQTVSRVLHEEVRFNTRGVTALDWVSYPILRFKDHPRVTPFLVQRTDEQPGGAGQTPVGSTVAAIGNAFFDATGVRMREAPMTPARVRATLAAAKAGTYK